MTDETIISPSLDCTQRVDSKIVNLNQKVSGEYHATGEINVQHFKRVAEIRADAYSSSINKKCVKPSKECQVQDLFR